jgi:hypothetical protein
VVVVVIAVVSALVWITSGRAAGPLSAVPGLSSGRADSAPAETPPAPAFPYPGPDGPPLPLRPDGYGQVLPTPAALADRRLPTVDLLPPPEGDRFDARIAPLTPEELADSTWHPGCPVPAERLRLLTMSFWGFDDRAHTGRMVVRDDVADDVVGVFGRLYAAHFPIEQMRPTTPADLAAVPSGQGNNTAAFACRRATGQSRFSAHALGLAVDVNPFQNPLQRRDGLVIPELASAYTDRARVRPGMLRDGDVAVDAFTALGWTWGARFRAPIDTMHFSRTGD